MMWAYRAPSGVIIEETAAHSRQGAWAACYAFLYKSDNMWGISYWKRLRASQASARRRGYRMVKVKLVAVDR